MQDMHGQIRVRRAQLGVELLLKGAVDGVPEGAATLADSGDVLGGWGAGGGGRELGADGFGEAGFEGAQAVDCARDTVEADALEADFAHEFGGLDVVGGCAGGQLVQGGQGLGRVHGHCCCRLPMH